MIILGVLIRYLTQSMIGQRAEVQGTAEKAIVDQEHVLVLRAHYTMDVIAGAAIEILAALAASRLADSCDRSLNRLAGS
mgnify:CR=1 FL=1